MRLFGKGKVRIVQYRVRKKIDTALKKVKAPKTVRLALLKQWINYEKDINEENAFDVLTETYPFPVGTSLSNVDSTVDEKIDVSIIVPAYNVEAYVDACLSSLIEQNTRYLYEIIVVNDGSTDHTLNRITKYTNNPLVKIIDKNNGGVSSARNSGLLNSHGKYISFVDADDIVEPNYVESLVSVAKKTDADIVQGNYRILSDLKSDDKKNLENIKIIKPFSSLNGYPWGKIYKASLFNKIKFPENFWFEDTMMMYRIWPNAKVVYSTSNVIYNYRINLDGIVQTSRSNLKALDSLYITIQLLHDLQKTSNQIQGLTQDIYNFTLKQMTMNFNRINFLTDKLQYASFLVMCKTINDNFPTEKYKTKDNRLKILENSLRKKDYGLFVAICLDA